MLAIPQRLLAVWSSYLAAHVGTGALKVGRLPRWGLAPLKLMFGVDAKIIKIIVKMASPDPSDAPTDWFQVH